MGGKSVKDLFPLRVYPFILSQQSAALSGTLAYPTGGIARNNDIIHTCIVKLAPSLFHIVMSVGSWYDNHV